MQIVVMPALTAFRTRVDEFLVVHAPVRMALGLEDRVADGVALPAVRPDDLDAAVDFLEPAR